MARARCREAGAAKGGLGIAQGSDSQSSRVAHRGAAFRPRSRRAHAGLTRTLPASDRDPPQWEPALELRLDRQLGSHLGLENQPPPAVPVLAAASGHERIEVAALVVVDPVQRPRALVLEREHGAQEALAVPGVLQGAGDGLIPTTRLSKSSPRRISQLNP